MLCLLRMRAFDLGIQETQGSLSLGVLHNPRIPCAKGHRFSSNSRMAPTNVPDLFVREVLFPKCDLGCEELFAQSSCETCLFLLRSFDDPILCAVLTRSRDARERISG